jgi:hypothetical protein
MKRLLCVAILSLPIAAYCQGTGDCTSALVKATYNRLDVSHSDWRIATLITENEWDTASKAGGANAVIYGIPVGASYSDFQNRVREKVNSYNESLTQSQLINIAWTGLDPSSEEGYITCILASQQGLQMYVNAATKKEVSLRVRWNGTGDEPRSATPSWTWNGPTNKALPSTLSAGYTVIVLPRPDEPRILAANFRGHDASVVITPYPPPPPPPEYTYVPCIETYASTVADGWGDNWSAPVTMCTPPKPEGWTITRLVLFNTTDFGTERACDRWGHCTGAETDTSTRICRSITVQGHNDNTHEGHGKLQGHMIVEWRQKLLNGEDPKKECHSASPLQLN